jgi:hypothetical protein
VAATALDDKEQTAMPRRFFRQDNWEFGGAGAPSEDQPAEAKSRKRRLATTLAFTTLFFAGASLAAVAGDQLSRYEAGDGPSAEATESTTTMADASAAAGLTEETAAPEAEAAATEAPAEETTAEADAAATAPTESPLDDATEAEALAASSNSTATADDTAPDSGRPAGSTASSGKSGKGGKSGKHARAREAAFRMVLLPKIKPAPAPEIEGPADAATIWLNSQLPDPTPAALRLSPKFAANLKAAAKGAGVDWAVMLGVLRARGATGHVPANRSMLRQLAGRLASHGPTKGEWATIVAYSGDSRFADRAAALARYDRAVGLNALVNGLAAEKKAIATRVLSDPMISIYGGGRNDIVQNRVDVRVLALIAYLRESFGQVTVSSLISGHRLYSRPGVVSAHIPGHAVDIAGLGGTPIQGHQEPGGMTERAVREILFLPAELMPRQVISLLGMGGPSFPMGDHYNHIHIGY